MLVQWGGNWCGWCIKLHDLYGRDAAIRKELLYEYDVVYVDIGKWDKNQDLATLYGADLKTGVPYLTVLDGQGKALANQRTDALEVGDAHDPAKVLAFLTENRAKYLKADDLLAAAQARAVDEKKLVFLTFDAPWCGWCHKLENWMETPQAKGLLAKDFVIRKIDIERTIGGKELKAKYCETESGIPWFCVLDGQGTNLSNSMYLVRKDGVETQENTGFPSTDQEIAAFATLLGKVTKNLTAQDIDVLKQSLVEVRENDKKQRQKAS
ncbi:MAG: thioredoxin family protein [Planctomycetota bacterium]